MHSVIWTGLIGLIYFCSFVISASCPPRSICYSPSDDINVTVTVDELLMVNLKYSPNNLMKNVTLRTDSGSKATMICDKLNKKVDIIGVSYHLKIFRNDLLDVESYCNYTFHSSVFNNSTPIFLEVEGFVPSVNFTISSLISPPASEQGLTFQQKRLLCKAHGSSARFWTEIHTDLGVISTVLAVAQPLNSLLRCAPTDPKRQTFNWAHRAVGLISYFSAVAALLIASFNFKKIWNEPILVMVLLSLPTVICFMASIGIPIMEKRRYREIDVKLLEIEGTTLKKQEQNVHPLRTPIIFWSIGVFFASTVALSLLIMNGFKN